jgi:hypothetical protein
LRAITIAIPGEGEGLLTLRVARRGAGVAVFEVVHDGSPVAQWVELRSATVRWVAQGRGTRVDWTFRYARLVGPGWYFGPILQFEARLAAGYLIDSVATPR